MAIRVLLAEDNALLRQGLERLIEHDDELELVASVADLPSLQKAVAEHEPDVVVSDIRMPPTKTDEGIQIAAQLRAERPGAGVVLLSQHADATFALRAAGRRRGRARLPAQGAGRGRRRADRRDPHGRRRRLGDRPDRGRAAGRGQPGPRKTPLDHPDPARARGARRDGAGQEQRGDRGHAWCCPSGPIEKHTNSIFAKLGLTEERDLNRRVKAVLLYLHEHGTGEGG